MVKPLNFVLRLSASVVCAMLLGSCQQNSHALQPPSAAAVRAPQQNVKTVVVIDAENRSFDNLFGKFPGANGLRTVMDAEGKPTRAYIPQKNCDGVTVIPTLVHRFLENQMQIHDGKNDGFAAWSNAGGFTMTNFDYSNSAMFKLAREFVLANNFFQGAFGGSFHNHQNLICACAPEYPNAATAVAKPSIAQVQTNDSGKFLPALVVAARTGPSALDGLPVFANSGNVTPANYFGDRKFYAINTMLPPYQPSGNVPAISGNALYADPDKSTILPAQTIGDLLNNKQVPWKWYSGSWTAAARDGALNDSARRVIYKTGKNGVSSGSDVDFETHHQPFNYYAAFDPTVHAANRAAHLTKHDALVNDITAGTLPSVVFYKPEGLYNQHEGNTDVDNGNARIANLAWKLRASSQWKNMVVVVTYDEFGGSWDHVAPPKGDLLGPGTRIPAIIISPFANAGTVDHTQYDTGSVMRLITRVFDLGMLCGLAKRDLALMQAGGKPMGDQTNALHFWWSTRLWAPVEMRA